jgi:hypothetical protein
MDSDDGGHTDAMICPACGQHFDQGDTTAAQLRGHLDRLRRQLADNADARPAKRMALERLEHRAARAANTRAAADRRDLRGTPGGVGASACRMPERPQARPAV